MRVCIVFTPVILVESADELKRMRDGCEQYFSIGVINVRRLLLVVMGSLNASPNLIVSRIRRVRNARVQNIVI